MTEHASGRSEYTVTINGTEHTVLLTEEEAKAQGATKAGGTTESKAAAPPNKSRGARTKDG